MGVYVVAEKGWFWRKQGSVFGPVTEEVLRARIIEGEITHGMPVRQDAGDWVPVETVEDWSLLLGAAENLRSRDREAMLRKGFGLAGLLAVLSVSAWSVASQVYPPPSRQASETIVTEDDTTPPAPTALAPEEDGLGRERIAAGFNEALPSLQGCAERFQMNGGVVPSQIALSYSIQNSGAVTDVYIHPVEAAASPMGRCMVGVMRLLNYPTFAGKARPVSFPVAFD